MNILYLTPEFSTSKGYLLNKDAPSGMPGQVKFIEYIKNTNNRLLIIAEFRNYPLGQSERGNIKINHTPGYLDTFILKLIHYFFPIVARKINYFLIFIKYYFVIRQFKPDIIYGCWYFGAGLGSYCSFTFSVPLIIRMFGTGLVTKIDKLDSIIKNIKTNGEYFHVYPFTVKSDAMIITADGTCGDKIASKLGFPDEKLFKLYNGIDSIYNNSSFNADLIKKLYSIPEDAFLFTYTGRLAGWKRTDRLLQVFKEINNRHENSFLLIGGFGRDQLEIERFAKKHKFSKRIKITGKLEQDKIFEILSISDVHLSLNDMTNLTNTTIEALSMGCAVVAVDVGETSEILKTGHNSILVKKDINGIVDNIIDLINDEPKRKKLGKNAIEDIKNKFYSWDERFEKELKILKRIVKKY